MTTTRPEGRPQAAVTTSTTPGTWARAEHRQIVPLRADRLGDLVRDVPAWVLWDPSVVRVEHDQGLAGAPGMVCQVVIGSRAAGMSFAQMMMGTSDTVTVFAGGRGRRWRFIDIFELTPAGPSTGVRRRLDIELHGWARLLRPLVSAFARRYLRRSLTALT